MGKINRKVFAHDDYQEMQDFIAFTLDFEGYKWRYETYRSTYVLKYWK